MDDWSKQCGIEDVLPLERGFMRSPTNTLIIAQITQSNYAITSISTLSGTLIPFDSIFHRDGISLTVADTRP